ncbi:site-specific integrase [Streptomyces sp. NPDC020362]|uniref:site-specific integrase n=1 Tax=unclassified Streptomyces TaxID=2593676 RepID=UPI0033CC9159
MHLNNIVADDVYRVTEQIVLSIRRYRPLKHRKVGDYRDVPLSARIRKTIERYAEKYGTVDNYLLRQQIDPRKPYPHWGMDNQWPGIRASGQVDIPEGMVLYGNRHFYASNCLSNGIPITDVAEWMGHNSVGVTFKIYRHLLPGSIGKGCAGAGQRTHGLTRRASWPRRRPGLERAGSRPSCCCPAQECTSVILNCSLALRPSPNL